MRMEETSDSRLLSFDLKRVSGYLSTYCDLCTPEGIRTPDSRIRNPMLYPAELRARENRVIIPQEAWLETEGNGSH